MSESTRRVPERSPKHKRSVEAPAADGPAFTLQRMIGNRAARSLLAREPIPTDTASKEASIEISDLGSTPILSWSFADHQGAHSGQTGRPHPDLIVSSRTGDISARIAQAAANGHHFDTAVVTSRGVTVTLHDVYVSSFESGRAGDEERIDGWRLSYSSIEYKPSTGG